MLIIWCVIYGSSRLNHGWLVDPQWSSACSEAGHDGTQGPSWPTRPSLVPRLPTQNLLLTARPASLKPVGSRRTVLARFWAVRTWFVGFWGWIRVSIVSSRISNIATGFCDPAFLWEWTDCYVSKLVGSNHDYPTRLLYFWFWWISKLDADSLIKTNNPIKYKFSIWIW